MIVAMSSTVMRVEYGDSLAADCADGLTRPVRALSRVVAGGDFAVVWACSDREWEKAQFEHRQPKGIPWPAGDVTLA